jgi:hypothetical protein
MNKRTNRRIRELMNETREALEQEESVPLSVRDAVENLVDAVGHILEYLGQNSGNSHVPPSKDIGKSKGGKKDKEKKSKEGDSRKVGGQPGHEGNYLPLNDTEKCSSGMALLMSNSMTVSELIGAPSFITRGRVIAGGVDVYFIEGRGVQNSTRPNAGTSIQMPCHSDRF